LEKLSGEISPTLLVMTGGLLALVSEFVRDVSGSLIGALIAAMGCPGRFAVSRNVEGR